MGYNPNNGMQQTQGFGVTPQPGQGAISNDDQWKIASALAGMPDSSLTQGLFNAQQPGGDMVGKVYVGQSPLQGLNAAMRQGMGGMMVKNRADQAQGLIDALRKNQPGQNPMAQGGQQGYGPQNYADLDKMAAGYVGPNGESVG